MYAITSQETDRKWNAITLSAAKAIARRILSPFLKSEMKFKCQRMTVDSWHCSLWTTDPECESTQCAIIQFERNHY
jgi:hypothetical protein